MLYVLRSSLATLCLLALLTLLSLSIGGKVYAAPAVSSNGKVFVFDPRRLKWYAYNDGQMVNSGPASGGRGYCSDVRRRCYTPVGQFAVYSKGGSGCRSGKYPIRRSGRNGGAPMPYCMFFRHGFGIHGSPDVPAHNASHGCIRVKQRNGCMEILLMWVQK